MSTLFDKRQLRRISNEARPKKLAKQTSFQRRPCFSSFDNKLFFLVSESKKFIPIQHLELELINWGPVGCLETLTVVNAIDKVPVLYRRLTDVLIGSPR